jgi:tryptophan synthase alpha chain
MSGHDTISAAIRSAVAQGEPALVAFMTAGYPSRERFREHLQAVAAGADVVEIGVPFTDPMADGVTIQRSSHAALAQGVSLRWIFSELEAMQRVKTPVLLMSYLNPLLAFGVARLPLDESAELQAALDACQIALVQMVTPVTKPERMQQLCAGSQGFVYAVTMTGTTGKNVAVPAEVIGYLDRVRELASVPVCAGFGIRSREQVELLKGHVDGVVVGSALVEVLERGENATEWLQRLRKPRVTARAR